ncbi:MAG: fatty acid desaturase [Myxococcota bacterium]
MDLDAFGNDLRQLGAELRQECGPADLAHLRRIERWGYTASLLGWATAWIAPNPLSILALSTGRFARWTMVGHHVGHRGYDRLGRAGKPFGEGARRVVDWFDWLVPAAWKHEHNVLHHYRLNEAGDPDLVEENLRWLRESRWPRPARYLLVFFFALTWKWLYYAPNTIAELHRADQKVDGAGADLPRGVWTWDPRTPAGRDLWLRSVLPYASVHFVLLPALFLLVSPWAAASVLVNQVLAELLTNLHSFAVIVPNHAGGDLYRFETPTRSKQEFLLRQVLGSANFRTGGDLNDFAHGFLNYQIEHHLWPDLPMAAYQRAQPRVQALCARHGVPYVQESVWRRLGRTVRVMVGEETMRVHQPVPSVAQAADGSRTAAPAA